LHWLVVGAELLKATSEIEFILSLGWRRVLGLSLGCGEYLFNPLLLLFFGGLLTELNSSPDLLVLVNGATSSLCLPLTPPLSILFFIFLSFLLTYTVIGPITLLPLVLGLLIAVAVVHCCCICLKVLVRHLCIINQYKFKTLITYYSHKGVKMLNY